MNPKFLITFKEDDVKDIEEEPIKMKVTLAIAEKNWKKLNPNTVSGMIGLYMLEKREGKLTYSEDVVVKQTSFLPVKEISMEVSIGENRAYNKNGYLIMPSTYESKIQGTFIVSVKCDRPFEITSSK
jgi:calpain